MLYKTNFVFKLLEILHKNQETLKTSGKKVFNYSKTNK